MGVNFNTFSIFWAEMRRLRCFCLCLTGFEKLCTRYRPRGSVIACRPCVIIVLRGTLASWPPNICDLASVLPVGGSDGVSNHRRFEYLLNLSIRRKSNKTSKLHTTGLWEGNSPVPDDSPHKGPVTRKISQVCGCLCSYIIQVCSTRNRPISLIPQCIGHISNNAPICYRNVHISVTKLCVVGYGTGALRNLCTENVSIRYVCM